jgi:signal transduction histidine kinase/DNA-binding response OmpR family regulator
MIHKSKLKYFAIYLLLIFSINIHAQKNKIDSLKLLLQKEKNDSIRWLQCMRLSVAYVPYNKDSSMLFCKKALSIAETTKSPYMLYYAYNEMGNCYSDQYLIPEAAAYYQKSYDVSEKNPSLDKNFPLGNLASINITQSKYKEAKEMIKRIISDYQKANKLDSARLHTQYQNLGSCNYGLEEFKDAEVNFQKAIAFNDKNNLYSHHENSNNLAASYRELKQYQKAIDIFKNNKIDDKLSYDDLEVQRLIGLGITYFRWQKYTESLASFNSISLPSENITLGQRQDIYLYKAKCHEKLNDFPKALDFYKKYQIVTDSLNKKIYDDKIIGFESNIKLAEQEKRMASAQLEAERSKSSRKNWQILFLSTLFIGGFLSSLYYYRQKLKSKEIENFIVKQKLETAKAKEMEELKTAFFTNLSHEFRTPITLIREPINELMKNGRTDQKPLLSLVNRQVEKLYTLINQLLDLTKVDTCNMPVSDEHLDLTSFFEDITHDFKEHANSKNINFEVLLPPSSLVIKTDAEKVKTICNNLLSNAFKFTPSGQNIHFNCEVNESTLKIIVKDTGKGIAPEMLNKIFDRFVSVNNAQNVEGTGIGLALTKELITLLKGSIDVSSQPNLGTEFICKLPIKILDHEVDKADQDTISTYEKEILKPSILIIEDNEDMQYFLKELLQDKWNVIQAYNAHDGYNHAIEVVPDIIISDVMMPGEDGIAFVSRLKKNRFVSHIPAILLTAKTRQEDKISGLKAGAVDYITKPFDSKELHIKLHNILELRREKQDVTQKKLLSIQVEFETEISEDEKFMNTVKEELEANYESEQYSVERLGQNVGMSRSQLYRKVHALTGESPVELLKNYRLTKAKNLLQQRVGNVSEIAFRTGFGSSSYFIKCFKDKYGYTPSKIIENDNM